MSKAWENAMRKVQVFLREDQKSALRAIAARTGEKQSDLIRQGVDLLIVKAKEAADWREVTREVAGMWEDRDDLEAFDRDFRAAAKRRFPSVYGRT
jgi:hypothetical protein